ncbi:hypothetical protein EDD85DRAFT_488860 [Armillaria nabsnona]|nr:hypothetical protein EDD85DRAFT_488860 [Armillaria nabsnona]
MPLPAELILLILSDLWAIQSSTDEHIETFTNCSLVSKQWSATMKDVNSTHSVIAFSYNARQLYTIPSMSAMSNPPLCRTITLRVDYMIMSQFLPKTKCGRSIVANKGIESILRKLFYGPNAPRNATHIYIDYLDDPRSTSLTSGSLDRSQS